MVKSGFIKGMCLPIVFVLALFSAPGFADSRIIPSKGFTSSAQADVLVINPPNQYGISINRYDQFVVDNPLEIVTAPTSLSAAGKYLSPKTVVIMADNITLNSKINLLGTATDIVFLAPQANSTITCNKCVFNNLLRGTLAAAKPLNSINSEIGTLVPGAKSKITINGLFAPGTIGFDVIASDLTLGGTLDTHQRVSEHAAGGLVTMAHSSFLAGSGGFDFIVGNTRWDYEHNKITHTQASTKPVVINGNINSIYTKITSTAPLTVNANINSQVDYVVGVPYQGINHLPVERIELQVLGAAQGAPLIVKGNLTTSIGVGASAAGSSVVLRSNDAIHLNKATVMANNLELAALGLFKNNASQVVADNISAAVGTLENEGTLKASANLDVFAQQALVNQYGGFIQGHDVVLTSANQIFRNGSRTPYKSLPSDTDYFYDINSDDFLNQDSQNLQELGAFYYLESPLFVKNSNTVMARENTAQIVGNAITITAKAIENINPYYQNVQGRDSLELPVSRTNQVGIYAQDKLALNTPPSGYLLNASAVLMQANSSSAQDLSAKAVLNTGIFLNDRYRVVTTLSYNKNMQFVDVNKNGVRTETDSTVEAYNSETVYYSPPGRLVFMGNANLSADSAFVSNLSYLEFYGNTSITADNFRDFGLQNQGYGRGRDRAVEVRYIVGVGLVERNGSDTDVVLEKVDPRDLDSLFYASQNISFISDVESQNDPVLFQTLNVFDYFVSQSVKSVIDSAVAEAEKWRATQSGTEGGFVSFKIHQKYIDTQHTVNSTQSMKDDNTVQVKLSHTLESEKIFSGATSGTKTTKEVEGESTQVSLLDSLAGLYDKLVHKLKTLVSEWSWWKD